MTDNPKFLAALAALGSAGLLLGALYFQYFQGLPPCHLCILQRWPHGIAIALGVLAVALGWRVLPLAGAAAMIVGAGIAVYHTGVERGFWEGPSTCTTSQGAGLSTDQLLDQIMKAPIVRCDEVAWTFLHLSMASWNAIFSLVLAGIWLMAFRAASR